MTEVIAVRQLWWEGEPRREVLVSIGKPVEAPGVTGEFYCPIQTSGLGNDEFATAIFGANGFQAIELALGSSVIDWPTSKRETAVICGGSLFSCRRNGRSKNNDC